MSLDNGSCEGQHVQHTKTWLDSRSMFVKPCFARLCSGCAGVKVFLGNSLSELKMDVPDNDLQLLLGIA